MIVGKEEGSPEGILDGVGEGWLEGRALGVDDGKMVGVAVFSMFISILQTVQLEIFRRSPTTTTKTVSSETCTVSWSSHWSSCMMKLAPSTVLSKDRRPVESPKLIGEPIVPYTPGGNTYVFLNNTSILALVTPSNFHVSKEAFSMQLISNPF
jgi:hypothetical protein